MSSLVHKGFERFVREGICAICAAAMLAACFVADKSFAATEPGPRLRIETSLQADGTGVQVAKLSPEQVENLALLGQVWGFLKYHHPAVRIGQRAWDIELLRELPAVLAAPDRAGAAVVLVRWIDALGPVPPCHPCVTDAAASTVHFRPAVDWLSDSARLTPALSQRLLHIYRNRAASGKQFYVSLAPYVNNPVFSNEQAHADVPLADRGYRLLAVFRFWNDIEYWFPYRDIIGEDWHAVLPDVIPHVVLADSDLAVKFQ